MKELNIAPICCKQLVALHENRSLFWQMSDSGKSAATSVPSCVLSVVLMETLVLGQSSNSPGSSGTANSSSVTGCLSDNIYGSSIGIVESMSSANEYEYGEVSGCNRMRQKFARYNVRVQNLTILLQCEL